MRRKQEAKPHQNNHLGTPQWQLLQQRLGEDKLLLSPAGALLRGVGFSELGPSHLDSTVWFGAGIDVSRISDVTQALPQVAQRNIWGWNEEGERSRAVCLP